MSVDNKELTLVCELLQEIVNGISYLNSINNTIQHTMVFPISLNTQFHNKYEIIIKILKTNSIIKDKFINYINNDENIRTKTNHIYTIDPDENLFNFYFSSLFQSAGGHYKNIQIYSPEKSQTILEYLSILIKNTPQLIISSGTSGIIVKIHNSYKEKLQDLNLDDVFNAFVIKLEKTQITLNYELISIIDEYTPNNKYKIIYSETGILFTIEDTEYTINFGIVQKEYTSDMNTLFSYYNTKTEMNSIESKLTTIIEQMPTRKHICFDFKLANMLCEFTKSNYNYSVATIHEIIVSDYDVINCSIQNFIIKHANFIHNNMALFNVGEQTNTNYTIIPNVTIYIFEEICEYLKQNITHIFYISIIFDYSFCKKELIKDYIKNKKFKYFNLFINNLIFKNKFDTIYNNINRLKQFILIHVFFDILYFLYHKREDNIYYSIIHCIRYILHYYSQYLSDTSTNKTNIKKCFEQLSIAEIWKNNLTELNTTQCNFIYDTAFKLIEQLFNSIEFLKRQYDDFKSNESKYDDFTKSVSEYDFIKSESEYPIL